MASPQSENGHTRIANEILDHIVKLPLNGTESRIIMAVWRYTYGFSRKDHKLSISFLLNYLGLKPTQYKQIKNAIDSLIEMKLLIETKKPDPKLNTPREIAFNKDYDLWCNQTSGLKRPEVQKDQSPIVELDQSPLVQLDQKDKQDIKTNIKTSIYSPVIDYLNEKTGTNYKASTAKTKALIDARIKDGFTLDDFKMVIEIKVKEWNGTEFEKFLRPETLFGTKFESYLNQKDKPSKKDIPQEDNRYRRTDI